MTNNDFINDYVNGNITTPKANGHLATDGINLYSYSTPICSIDPIKKVATLNRTRYSVTTSRHQTATAYLLSRAGYIYNEIDNVAMNGGWWNFGFQGAEIWTQKENGII